LSGLHASPYVTPVVCEEEWHKWLNTPMRYLHEVNQINSYWKGIRPSICISYETAERVLMKFYSESIH
jgi:hypothetical protein